MRPLSTRLIWNVLCGRETGPFGANVHYHPRIGSTNGLARELAANHAPEGTLVITDEQTAGRGRMGRVWEAPPNTSLLMSVIFRPGIPPGIAYRVVTACGLAIAEACEALADVQVVVKWPNDLQIGGKKFAGILPESAVVGEDLLWIVVGMGINVNQIFEAGDPLGETATSLRVATGSEHDRAALLAEIMTRLSGWYARLGDDALPEAWRARCVTIGQRVRAGVPGGSLEGLAEDIDPSGALWLRDDTGQRHRLNAGETTLLL